MHAFFKPLHLLLKRNHELILGCINCSLCKLILYFLGNHFHEICVSLVNLLCLLVLDELVLELLLALFVELKFVDYFSIVPAEVVCRIVKSE